MSSEDCTIDEIIESCERPRDLKIEIQLIDEFKHRIFCYRQAGSLETIKLRQDIVKRREELKNSDI